MNTLPPVHVDAEALLAEGQQFEVVSGRRIQVVAGPSVESARNMAIGLTIVDPGGETPRHTHDGVEEALYVIAGSGRFLVGDVEIDVRPGSVLLMPSDVPHHAKNTGESELHMLWWYAPAGPDSNIKDKRAGA
jgi:quercetin dioxygenase-like cupin family protein